MCIVAVHRSNESAYIVLARRADRYNPIGSRCDAGFLASSSGSEFRLTSHAKIVLVSDVGELGCLVVCGFHIRTLSPLACGLLLYNSSSSG